MACSNCYHCLERDRLREALLAKVAEWESGSVDGVDRVLFVGDVGGAIRDILRGVDERTGHLFRCGEQVACWQRSETGFCGCAAVDDKAAGVQTMIRMDGGNGSFRCDCGANVFTKLPSGKFSCNGCPAIYTGM